MKKPLLIFDFFGVVVGEVAHIWLHEHVSPEVAAKIIATTFVNVDEGIITPEECFIELEKITGVDRYQIEKDWIVNGYLKKDTYEFIKKNRDRFHIVLLSNAGVSFINKLFALNQGLKELFLHTFISAEIKLAKPSPLAFQYVLEHTPAEFDFAIMIDDSYKNIEAAKKAGLEGIIFENMDQVLQEINAICQKRGK